MKLYTSKFSPYGRKVRLWAYALGCDDQIELIDLSATGTFVRPTNYEKINPLGKVPALQINDSTAIIDSPLICDFLSRRFSGNLRFPFEDQNKKTRSASVTDDILDLEIFDLQREAIADGLCDAAVLRRGESQRPPEQRSEAFDLAQKEKVLAALRYFEEQSLQMRSHITNSTAPDVAPYSRGEVGLMAALGYLEFRFAHEPWRDHHPKLARWFHKVSQWEPFRMTRPEIS